MNRVLYNCGLQDITLPPHPITLLCYVWLVQYHESIHSLQSAKFSLTSCNRKDVKRKILNASELTSRRPHDILYRS